MDFSKIKGLEKYYSGGPRTPFVKILNGKAALTAGLPEGTIVDSVTGVELAAPGDPFKFIPIYYFEDWSIWEDTKLIKKSFSKTGTWSDGSEIFPEEVEWEKDADGRNIPSIAKHSHNLIVLPVGEVKSKEETKRHLILSFLGGNEYKAQAQKELFSLLTKKIEALELGALYGAAYSISTKEVQNKSKKKWFEFCDPTFIKKVAAGSLAIADKVYEDVAAAHEQDLQKSLAAPSKKAALPPAEKKTTPKKEKVVEAEVVDETPEVDEDADF